MDNNNSDIVKNLTNIESLVSNYQLKLDNITSEIKQYKQMFNSILENDDEYQKVSEEVAKLNKDKKIAKQKLLIKPETKELVEKIKDYQHQIKEIKPSNAIYMKYIEKENDDKVVKLSKTIHMKEEEVSEETEVETEDEVEVEEDEES
jgi:hypothetical protein